MDDQRFDSERIHYNLSCRTVVNKRAKRRQRRRRKVMTSFSILAGIAIACEALVQVYHTSIRRRNVSVHSNGMSVVITQNTSAKTSVVRGAMTSISKREISPSTTKVRSRLLTREEVLDEMMRRPLPTSALIQVQAQSQLPQLKNGCEVTSLSMLLSYMKHPVSKMVLAEEEPKDNTPLVMKNNKIVSWGNPNVGFVGSVKGDTQYGYGIYHGPLTKLADNILPKRGLDLTGSSFRKLEAIIAGGTPVVIWTTYTFKPIHDWITWKTPEGSFHATMQEHAVLLVGFGKNDVYIANPANGEADQKVPMKQFVEAWNQLGRQAITIAPKQYATS